MAPSLGSSFQISVDVVKYIMDHFRFIFWVILGNVQSTLDPIELVFLLLLAE